MRRLLRLLPLQPGQARRGLAGVAALFSSLALAHAEEAAEVSAAPGDPVTLALQPSPRALAHAPPSLLPHRTTHRHPQAAPHHTAAPRLDTRHGLHVVEDDDFDEARTFVEDEADGSRAALVYPGNFSHKLDERDLQVQPAEGLALVVQPSIQAGRGEGATLMAQLSYSPHGSSAVLLVADQRAPTLTAALLPGGPSGRVLRLSTNAKPAEWAKVKLEANLALPGAWQSAALTAECEAHDFFAEGSLHVPLDAERAGGPVAELTYHQSLGAASGLTAGGRLKAYLHPSSGGALGALLAHRPQALDWATHGSWTSRSKESGLLARYEMERRAEAPPLEATSLLYWRTVGKTLELCAGVHSKAEGLLATPVESGASVGMRLKFGDGGQMFPVLTAHATSDLVLGVSLVLPNAAQFSQTYMRSTLSTVLDHKNKDFKAGLSVEMYY
jgi:hypothetical protein